MKGTISLIVVAIVLLGIGFAIDYGLAWLIHWAFAKGGYPLPWPIWVTWVVIIVLSAIFGGGKK